MKLYRSLAFLTVPFLLASCAEPPLQQMVAEHKQERLQETYSNKPVGYGSSDGVGMYAATAPHAPVTLNDSPANGR
jgi:hypothetical protein